MKSSPRDLTADILTGPPEDPGEEVEAGMEAGLRSSTRVKVLTQCEVRAMSDTSPVMTDLRMHQRFERIVLICYTQFISISQLKLQGPWKWQLVQGASCLRPYRTPPCDPV